MVSAYAEAADSMITVSDTVLLVSTLLSCPGNFAEPLLAASCQALSADGSEPARGLCRQVQQNEYATDPDLWRILDSDEDDPEGAFSGADDEKTDLIPAQYELDEDGYYKTAADMRAAYGQLRHVLKPDA